MFNEPLDKNWVTARRQYVLDELARGRTYADLANDLKVSSVRVQQIRMKALQRGMVANGQLDTGGN